jgi:nucleoside-diphosphate-sugar epimerase
MTNILITGITGFIGQSLAKYFQLANDTKLFGYSRNSKSARALFAQDHIAFLPELSRAQLDKHHIDLVIHLAGIAHDLSGNYQDDDYERVNFGQTRELYDEYLISGATRFVFVSSIKAVVDHANEQISENTLPDPKSAYGKSKQKAERYIATHGADGKRNYILRPCMVHGPGNKGNLNLLYNFVKRGIPYPLAAFHNQRSFLSIDNFCFIIEKIIAGHLSPGAYLLADSETISTIELVKLIGIGLGKKVRMLRLPKGVVYLLAKLGYLVNAPLNNSSLIKLTENLIVSNKKLLLNLKSDLPLTTRQGLLKTIKAFDEQP